jgi:hypothetical protein
MVIVRCIDYVSFVRIGLLKRSVIALLVLALAGVWQIAPSFAAQPCDMNNGTALIASHSSIACNCQAVARDCAKAAICCQISPNLLGSFVFSVAPIDWHRVIYSGDARTLAGRRLAPDLHPPTTRV